jgi:hypothetical protein
MLPQGKSSTSLIKPGKQQSYDVMPEIKKIGLMV